MALDTSCSPSSLPIQNMFLQSMHTLEPASCLLQNVIFCALPSCKSIFNVKSSLIAMSPAFKYKPPKGDTFSEQKICSKMILIHWLMPESKELTSELLFNMTTSQADSLERTFWNSTNDMYMHHIFLLELASWFPGWTSSA